VFTALQRHERLDTRPSLTLQRPPQRQLAPLEIRVGVGVCVPSSDRRLRQPLDRSVSVEAPGVLTPDQKEVAAPIVPNLIAVPTR
jgi:hypothetical protein